jgi:hypothetical protein
VIANLRVRLSLSAPTSSPELDKGLGGASLADRRPLRVTLRSKTAGPGRKSSGKITETRSSRCQETALAPQTIRTGVGHSDGGKIAEATVRRQEMAASPSRITGYSPAKRPPAHSVGRHTETENIVNRPMASLTVPVTQLKRGSSKVTFSDSEAVGPQNLRNSTGRQAYFIKFINLCNNFSTGTHLKLVFRIRVGSQCRPGSSKLTQYGFGSRPCHPHHAETHCTCTVPVCKICTFIIFQNTVITRYVVKNNIKFSGSVLAKRIRTRIRILESQINADPRGSGS